MMKKLVFLFAALTICVIADAQPPDTVKVAPPRILNDPFPATRDFELQYEQLGPRNFHSRLFDQNFQQGKIKSERRFLLAANIPFIKQRKYTPSGSSRYVNDAFNLTELNPAGPGTLVHGTDDHPVFHFFSVAASFTYFAKLFGKPLVLNTSVTTDGNDEGLQRVTGMASAACFKKNRQLFSSTAYSNNNV